MLLRPSPNYFTQSTLMDCPSNERRISCKKRENRKVFELRRQLNSGVRRRCTPDDRRRFRRPLYGRKASIKLTHLNSGGIESPSALKCMLGFFLLYDNYIHFSYSYIYFLTNTPRDYKFCLVQDMVFFQDYLLNLLNAIRY